VRHNITMSITAGDASDSETQSSRPAAEDSDSVLGLIGGKSAKWDSKTRSATTCGQVLQDAVKGPTS